MWAECVSPDLTLRNSALSHNVLCVLTFLTINTIDLPKYHLPIFLLMGTDGVLCVTPPEVLYVIYINVTLQNVEIVPYICSYD